MVNLMDLVAVASLPGLGAAGEAVLKMYETVDQVKVHKQRCKLLRNQCVETLNVLKDRSEQVETSEQLKDALNVFEAKVQKIHEKMLEWGALNLMQSLIKQSEISTGLDELYHDLQYCNDRFQMAGTTELEHIAQVTQTVYEEDAAELREQLLHLVRKADSMKALLLDTKDVEQLMQTLQEEIQSEPSSASADLEHDLDQDMLDLQAGLYFLHKQADMLPPCTDLTPVIEKITDQAVTQEGHSDVYIGRWLGQESVALKFTRGCNHSETAKKKFFNQVSFWRGLKHPNIVRPYGTATFGGSIYTVTPWMDNGDATQFLEHHPDHDRRQLLLEVAQGIQYLHDHGIVHGDIRCANVLISRGKVARVADFGLTVLINDIAEAAGADRSVREGNASGLRWRAPELIDPPSGSRMVITPASDVWSYGMLCLEAMTGEQPFHNMNDVNSMKAIVTGNLPHRPARTFQPLDDRLWQLIQACWQKNPEARPSMQQVVNQLRRAKSMSDSGEGSSIYSSPQPISTTLPDTQTISEVRGVAASIITSPSTLSEPSIPFPRSNPPDSQRRSPGLETITSMSDRVESNSRSNRMSVSQYPWSFAHAQNQSPTNGEKPLPITPLTRWIPHSPQSARTQSMIFSAPRDAPFTNSNAGASTSRSQHPPSSYQPSGGSPTSMASGFLLQRRPSRPPRNPNRPIQERMNGTHHRAGSDPHPQSQFGMHEESFSLRFNEDGSVRCGSVPALVRRLLTESESLVETIEFRDAFLTCYTAFMTAEELFKSLISSYKAVDEDPAREESNHIRYTILKVLQAWLTRHRAFPKDAALVQEIRNFLEGITNPLTIKKGAEQVLDVVRTKEIEILRPRRFDKAHSSRLYDGFRASLAHPRDFAIGFTLMAWDMYSDLLPSDFIAWLMESNTLGGREFIESHISLWSKISYWTRNLILQPEKGNARTARLVLFISIANECRKLHNYPCMNAIVNGCNSPLITRLRYTFGDLDKTAKEALESMSSLVDPRDSFRSYRNEIEHYSRHRRPLIPDLAAVHARDIKSLWTTKSGTVHFGAERLVNFERYLSLTESINLILSYQKIPIDLERYREAGPLAYLECQLDKFEVTDEVQRNIQTRAERLQRTEELEYNTRLRGIQAAGFAIQPKSSRRR